MHFQKVTIAALAATLASAQDVQNLTAALGGNENLSSLTTLVSQYPDLLGTLGNATNITLLAPSNEALDTLLNSTAGQQAAGVPGFIQALLSYHVLNGTFLAANVTNSSQFIPTALTNSSFTNVTGGQVVEAYLSGENVTIFSGLKNNVSVSQADIAFSGGVIHIIDGVLTVPQNVTATAQAANLTALTGAIRAANLTADLNGLSDVTIFAPNNGAFSSISSALSNASIEDLTSVLSYHVVNGSVAYSSDIENTTLTTLGGQDITISVVNGSVFVNSARVVNPDVLVANGVVHVIDGVLNPNNTQATADPAATTAAPAFSGASSASDVPFTSGVEAPTSSVAAAGTATRAPAAGGAAESSSSSGVAAMPMKTGAVGAAALFGGAALLANW